MAAKGGLLPFLVGSVWFVRIELARNGMKSRISLEWNEVGMINLIPKLAIYRKWLWVVVGSGGRWLGQQ